MSAPRKRPARSRAASDALDRHRVAVPQQRDRDLGHGDRKAEAVHSFAQVPVWRSGTLAIRSELRASDNAVAKAAHDGGRFCRCSPMRLQGLIDRSLVETAARDT